jgi:hypothetical protein
MSHEENNYKQFPALAAYIDRVGAEELSYKTFIVKTHIDKYYIDKCFIRIDTEARTITCTNPTYAPSPAEEQLILAELVNRVFPKPIGADDVSGMIRAIERKGGRVEKKDIFELWCRETNKIVMVQRRYQKEGENKQYHPWTLFDDGVWRQMEPGTALPFWKPKKKIANSIMVHEGAKAARFCEWLCRSNEHEAVELRKVHPWFEELNQYEHWGIIGGALAPHRANYSELRRERPADVVYVADNDDQGRRVLNSFSRLYEGSLKWVKFDSRWPKAWDLADKMPEELFSKIDGDRHYIGPSLNSLYGPATYATESIPNPEGRGRPMVVARTAFMEEWYHSVHPEFFSHRDNPSQLLSVAEFNSFNAPFSQVDDLARLIKRDAANKAFLVQYKPGMPPGLCGSVEDGQFINCHSGSRVKAIKGDPKPFLDYMEYLIPEAGDRHELMQWCATLIARPGNKMSYSVLLVSERQGTGKSTLGLEILRPLIGSQNVSIPNETQIVDSQFNSWAGFKRLVVVNEIYQGDNNKAYNKLKSYVADSHIALHLKHQAEFSIENWVHIFACSNSMRALKLELDDRRWLIPKVTEKKRDHAYWKAFFAWLSTGGLGIIKQWAEDFVEKHGAIEPGAWAPQTVAKKEMIEEAFSKGMQAAKWLLGEMKQIGQDTGIKPFTTDVLVIDEIRNRVYDGRDVPYLEKPLTIRKIAKGLGLAVGEVKDRSFSKKGELGRILSLDEEIANSTHSILRARGLKPFDFNMIASKI